ncbi:MAG TPA: sugar ABC transporter substrate-binding protein, partial [Aeromicrobium sp.]|nr:sugar ABC transporter substrate-binding protein [Aeromicrobium sp.]
MRLNKIATAAVAGLIALPLAACSSSGSGNGATTGSSNANAGVTLTYWASNQGTSLDNDKQVLTPELAKFTQQTGIKVNLQVVPWSDLLNQVLAATTSGKGP